MKTLAVIPARYGSTRFEGKPLADILGKPMIQWVYEGAKQSRLIEDVVVATDDERILKAVQQFGGTAILTSRDHSTGSDRVAEAAQRLPSEIIVNVQGDEPLITGRILDEAVRPLLRDEGVAMGTLMTPIRETRDWLNPNVVKVVVDRSGSALYFSRSPIPFPRGLDNLLSAGSDPRGFSLKGVFKHIGVYVYRRDFLFQFTRMPATPLEQLEKLEQLRALENGCRIKVTAVQYEPLSVDTPEDLQRVVSHLTLHPDSVVSSSRESQDPV
jgi:3-deoxy-manno-octulosonate cytidylyltransferase (CMP-KDO synthetase)